MDIIARALAIRAREAAETGVGGLTPSGGDDSAAIAAALASGGTIASGALQEFVLNGNLDLRGISNFALDDAIFSRVSGVSSIQVGGALDAGVTLTTTVTEILAGTHTVQLDTVSANPAAGDWHVYYGKIKGAWTTRVRNPDIQVMREVMSYNSGTKVVTYREAMPVSIDEVSTVDGDTYAITVQKVNIASNVRLSIPKQRQVLVSAEYLVGSSLEVRHDSYDPTDAVASLFKNVVDCDLRLRSRQRSSNSAGHAFTVEYAQGCNIDVRTRAVSYQAGQVSPNLPGKAFRANGLMQCIADLHFLSSGHGDAVIMGLIGGVTRITSHGQGVYDAVNNYTTGNRNDSNSLTFIRGARIEAHISEADSCGVEFFDARDSSAVVTITKTRELDSADTGLVSVKGFYENFALRVDCAKMENDRTNQIVHVQNSDWVSDSDMTFSGLASRRAPNNLRLTLGGGFAHSSGNAMVMLSGGFSTPTMALNAGTVTATYTNIRKAQVPQVGAELAIRSSTATGTYYYATVTAVRHIADTSAYDATFEVDFLDPFGGSLPGGTYTVWRAADSKTKVHNEGMVANELALSIQPSHKNVRTSGVWARTITGGHIIENYAKGSVFENGATPGGNLTTIRSISMAEARDVRVRNWDGGAGDIVINVPDQLNLQNITGLVNSRVSFGAGKTFRFHPHLSGWNIVGATEATVDSNLGLSQANANGSLGNAAGTGYLGTWDEGDELVKNNTADRYRFTTNGYFKKIVPTFAV